MKLDKYTFLGAWDGVEEMGFIKPVSIFIFIFMIPIILLGWLIMKKEI